MPLAAEGFAGSDYEDVAKFCRPKLRSFLANNLGNAIDEVTATSLEDHLRSALLDIPAERRQLLKLPFADYCPHVKLERGATGPMLGVYSGPYLFATLEG